MDWGLMQQLKGWRVVVARKEGVELYRVLSNKTIEEIAERKPTTKDELLDIKGIKEKKFDKYGKDILTLIKKYDEGSDEIKTSKQADAVHISGPAIEKKKVEGKEEKVLTVGEYIDTLNAVLVRKGARILGEISSVDVRGNYVFFNMKDKTDQGLLACFMWASDYRTSGVELEEGMEIVATGFPEVYKPSGRLTFRAASVELVGEGALKKAYEELKKKLEVEGLFAKEKKKPIPLFPQKIGLITSSSGAVIHDFLNNLGSFGYKIRFFDSRVEGQVAVKDLLSAISYFEDKDIDVLVIVRGGGSLESLQAFNNEILIRRIAEFKAPVIAGIGHDKDVPLASYVADLAVSTPTAVTVAINRSWEHVQSEIGMFERDIISRYQRMIMEQKFRLETLSRGIERGFGSLFKKFDDAKHALRNAMSNIQHTLQSSDRALTSVARTISGRFEEHIERIRLRIESADKRLHASDPTRQLKLGYSIVYSADKIVRSVGDVKKSDKIDIRVADGKITSQVENITKLADE